MTWLHDHTTELSWAFGAWAFAIAVVGGALLRRWHRHEDHDAAETEHVLETLGFDHTHAHDWDGWS